MSQEKLEVPGTPNRVVVLGVTAVVAYWTTALFLPGYLLRDIFNSLAFGAAMVITLTWMSAAARAVRHGGERGEWRLILGIFLLWSIVALQRSYAIVYNLYDRPESWADSAVTGFWPFMYAISGWLFLSSPSPHEGGMGPRAFWSIVLSVGAGSLVAGILIGQSISSY